MWEFDEALFGLDWLLDFEVTLTEEKENDILVIDAYSLFPAPCINLGCWYRLLGTIPAIQSALLNGRLAISIRMRTEGFARGAGKRVLIDLREKTPTNQ